MILDGKKVSEELLEEIKEKILSSGIVPKLAVFLIGENPASHIYVNNKKKAAEKIGIQCTIHKLPETITEEELLKRIEEQNCAPDTTGIIVQLPLPEHINKNKVAEAISPKKDVDGFHPLNVGRLAIGSEPYFYPATPQGIIMLLDKYKIELEGKNAVILGRSNIVGKPMAQMLLKRNATVTICHSYTQEIDNIIKTADIIISAVGKKIVRCKMVNKNSVIVDVGIFRDSNGNLTGDVDFDNICNSVKYISPVPGGVGPMTIASLMYNASKIYY